MEFIVGNNHPFTLVEEEMFIEFCVALNPSFKLRSSNNVISLIFTSYIRKYMYFRLYFRQNVKEYNFGVLSEKQRHSHQAIARLGRDRIPLLHNQFVDLWKQYGYYGYHCRLGHKRL